MNCRRARALLDAANPRSLASPGLRRHLAECPSCARYGERLAQIHHALGEHHGRVSPPAGFAARVRRRLPQEDDTLGWAARRLLPVTVGLVLLLSWLNWQREATTTDQAIDDPTSAVITWMLEPANEGDGS